MTMRDSRATILLVEDDHLLRDAFRLLLEDAGYRVREAGTAAEAIATANAKRPELILLDLGLPDASGLNVVRHLRQQSDGLSRVPIVALTGRVGAEERRVCIEAGCTSYFSKPIEPQVLLRELPRFLDAS